MDDSLSFESLLAGAKKFAGLALQAHRDQDDEVFVLHTGLSIERLMKAVLARTNPVLLMETGAVKDDRLLLHFAGLRPYGERIRTVSASGALARIRAAGWLTKDPELDRLIELRNGVVHLGPAEAESADVLATFGRTTNTLLARLGLDLADYWGDWESVIEISLNDQLERVERDVRRHIEQARHRYAERIRALPTSAVEAVREHASLGDIAGFPTEQEGPILFGRIACPACDNPHALVLLVTSRLGDGSRAERRAAYVGFGCSLCMLPLPTIKQFDATGIDVMDVRMGPDP
ncbi:hypothetical protein KBY91_15475 [Streptomyces sp. RK23]|uniref:hypothetical protein n=1 Tax=unclassified Streptomyces TaxID=2593676 RepID=UPI001B3776CE|nr:MULTISPECIES: hypothetical protein [unclassified Streptomyces]MBQ0969229.1 hypothetical protein [Streptomyces sp. RK74B]MBQ1004810.1 hypothetical protein [Streptomyces sp. RK23]